MADERAVHVAITGHVQGVGYRAWVETEARRHGLSGWVRNRRDGSVEALFAGDGGAVAAMLTACDDGPPAAIVEQVVAEDRTETVAGGFSVRPTA